MSKEGLVEELGLVKDSSTVQSELSRGSANKMLKGVSPTPQLPELLTE